MIIGISANYADGSYRIAQQYADCLMRAGVCTVILPISDSVEVIEQYMDCIHGLLLTGGGDMDPAFWGEEALPDSELTALARDVYDLDLYHAARRRCMPVMGICRGMQVMCVAEGGAVYQDIHKCYDGGALNHSSVVDKSVTSHGIRVLHPLFKDIRGVNSIHHQSISVLPEVFSLGAVAEDGVIEAFVSEHYPMFGVQWHPEHLAENMPEHAALFEYFARGAGVYAVARGIHTRSVVVDSHTDSPMMWREDMDLSQWQDDMLVDFRKMALAQMAATFVVAYIPQGDLRNEAQYDAFKNAEAILLRIKDQVDGSKEVALAYSSNDVISNHNKGIPSVVLAVENTYALIGRTYNVLHFYDMGVRYMTLCHNGDNDVCDSAVGDRTHSGLSSLGRTTIKKMNRCGMMIDISHASDESMEQAIEQSNVPVIASHSGARAVCGHSRNIPDRILRILAERKGVCQVCLYSAFLNDDSDRASIVDILSHVRHIVDLVGIDYVGIGSDFDGGGGIVGCASENEFINITMCLLNDGFSQSDVEKIMGGNFLRVWKDVERYKTYKNTNRKI